MKTIDLNCDMGESYGAWKMGADAEVMPYISSANIACGFHGGDPATIRKTVRLAVDHGVAVGAHPSLPDLVGFGLGLAAVGQRDGERGGGNFYHAPDFDVAVDVVLQEIAEDADGVTVTARSMRPEDAGAMATRTFRSTYVVGCDGTRSLVRETMGIDRWGTDFDERMVLAVFRSKQLHEGLKRFPELTTYRVLRPELKGYWQFFGRIDVGEGWFFHSPIPNDTDRKMASRVYEGFNDWIGEVRLTITLS